MGLFMLFIAKSLRHFLFSLPAQREISPAWWRCRGRSYVSKELLYLWWRRKQRGNPGDVPGALCAPYRVPLDVTGDVFCEGAKTNYSAKAGMDVDKRRRTRLIIGELGEFSRKMPPPYLAETSGPIRAGGCAASGTVTRATRCPFQSKGLKSKMSSVRRFPLQLPRL